MPNFRERVIAVIRLIPPGRVMTYGQVALFAGNPGAARVVGGILRSADREQDVPWQRVINAQGGISTFKVGAGELQIALLRHEGVKVEDGRVDLGVYRWEPDEGDAARLA